LFIIHIKVKKQGGGHKQNNMMQLIVIAVSVLALIYMYKKFGKKDIRTELIIAFLMSLIWVTQSGFYTYKTGNYILFGINLFPLVAWTAGLVLLKELYESMKGKYRYLKIVGFYLLMIMAIEYIGYNYWNIQINSCYPGLFGIEMMHMPSFGQLYYLTAGPLYIFITDKFGVK